MSIGISLINCSLPPTNTWMSPLQVVENESVSLTAVFFLLYNSFIFTLKLRWLNSPDGYHLELYSLVTRVGSLKLSPGHITVVFSLLLLKCPFSISTPLAQFPLNSVVKFPSCAPSLACAPSFFKDTWVSFRSLGKWTTAFLQQLADRDKTTGFENIPRRVFDWF